MSPLGNLPRRYCFSSLTGSFIHLAPLLYWMMSSLFNIFSFSQRKMERESSELQVFYLVTVTKMFLGIKAARVHSKKKGCLKGISKWSCLCKDKYVLFTNLPLDTCTYFENSFHLKREILCLFSHLV